MRSRTFLRSLLRSLTWLMALCLALPLAGHTPPALAEPSPVAEARASSDFEDATPVLGPAGQTLVTDYRSVPAGPGMTLTTFDRFDARGWVRGYALRVDLSNPAVRTDLLYPGSVAAAEPLSTSAARQGAVAGVNGDFFDINNTKAPLGAEVAAGELLKGPAPDRNRVAGVGSDGIGRIADVFLEGMVTLPGGDQPLASLNQPGIPVNGIGLFTPLWGTASRGAGAGNAAREVIVLDGKVVSNTSGVGSEPIPAGGFTLVGREAGAQALAGLAAGDAVSVTYQQRTTAPVDFASAVGGYHPLVTAGQIATDDDKDMHPRTAIGFSADGRTMLLVAVDGRQANSRGMTLLELAQLMQALGAHDALNLDGGGSTTFLSRLPGDAAVSLINNPSDGGERHVPNGLGIFVKPGSGTLSGLRVEPLMGNDRVFPGLTRRFTATGYDELFGPAAAGSVQWQALPGDVGRFEAPGVFQARKAGSAVVEAQAQSVKGTVPVRVLGELARLETDPARLGLAAGATGTFRVIGYDADGYAAPIEPADVTLSYDQSLLSITPTPSGSYLVQPGGEGAALVTINVAGKRAYLPVTVGLSTVSVAGFEPGEGWTCTKYPASVGATCGYGSGRTGQGLVLDYDFTTTTATRAAYVQKDPNLALPGEPQRIGLWVKGDGKGAWLRMVIRDGGNTTYTLNLASQVDWTGWKYVEAVVPPGVRYPIRLYRIYPVETKPAVKYTGQLVFDDLVVRVTASLEVPAQPMTPDPLVVQGPLGADRWKFAVLSDLHVVAANPASKDVANARTALRQAVAAGVDFIVINGDFVDTAYPQDFALAQQILDEEVGGRLPVYYTPGNHEIMGTADLTNFTVAFGRSRYAFDHKGTRFILLNSATGSYRTAEFQQLVELKAQLDQAASDPAVKNVVVLGHHPTRDPMPTASSQLSDPKEARLVEQWLTQFLERSGGKGALYVSGHAHTVNVQRVEGVPYVVLGAVGKTPYGPANQGGFHAWALFAVDPTAVPDRAQGPEQAAAGSRVAGTEWVQVEMRPVLESIALTAPATMKVGAVATVTATGLQPGGRTFPLAYPASVTWTGSENVLVGSGDTRKYAAQFDPATGELKALAAGSVTLRVESGGVSAEVTITVEP